MEQLIKLNSSLWQIVSNVSIFSCWVSGTVFPQLTLFVLDVVLTFFVTSGMLLVAVYTSWLLFLFLSTLTFSVTFSATVASLLHVAVQSNMAQALTTPALRGVLLFLVMFPGNFMIADIPYQFFDV